MEQEKPKAGMNNVLAVLAGVIATVATGAILYPLEQLAADEFFELNFSVEDKGPTFNDIMFMSSIAIWFGLASIGGGLVSSLLSRAYEYIHTYILTGIMSLVLLSILIGDGHTKTWDWIIYLIVVLLSFAGFVTGTRWGIRIKNKRRKV